jgi:ABC-type molybdate transport system substrate-binding protein
VVSIPLPPELTVTPAFGLVVLRENPLADRLALFILSEPGQAILANYGFSPVASATP